MATITSHYAIAAVAGAQRLGVDVDTLYREAQLSREHLALPNSRVMDAQMTRLIRRIWSHTADEFMGFTPNRCKSGVFALVLEVLQHSQDLREMLSKMIHIYSLITQDITMKYHQNERECQFVVTMQDVTLDPQHFYQEFWLVIWHRVASWLLDTQIELSKVSFTYAPPSHIDELRLQFRCPLLFNQSHTALYFPSEYASRKPVRTRQEIEAYLRRSPADLMTMPAQAGTLTRKIKARLMQMSHAGVLAVSAKEIANELHISEATLRRRLMREGQGFQGIKDGLRRDQAMDMLSKGDLPVHEVAEKMGFSEARSFTRAFRQWTGLSPRDYKKLYHNR